jgi:hypothetical protein
MNNETLSLLVYQMHLSNPVDVAKFIASVDTFLFDCDGNS